MKSCLVVTALLTASAAACRDSANFHPITQQPAEPQGTFVENKAAGEAAALLSGTSAVEATVTSDRDLWAQTLHRVDEGTESCVTSPGTSNTVLPNGSTPSAVVINSSAACERCIEGQGTEKGIKNTETAGSRGVRRLKTRGASKHAKATMGRRRRPVEGGAAENVSVKQRSEDESKHTAVVQGVGVLKAIPAGGGTRGGHAAAGGSGFRSKVRNAIFPIYGSQEIRKFVTMGMVKFFIIFVLTLTRDLKDTLIVTSCGAEAISFLKVYGVLPAATIFTVYYSYLSSKLGRRALFYVTVIPFFVFYVMFNAFIYPNLHLLHPTHVAASLSGLPQGLSYIVSLWQNWSFALFYVISELYSSVSIGVLFWQFANDVIPVEQAKRFYPLFGQMSSLAPIVAGQSVIRFATQSTFDVTLRVITTLVSFSGLAICLFYELSCRIAAKEGRAGYVRAAPAKLKMDDDEDGVGKGKGDGAAAVKRKKPKMGLSDSFRVLSRSRYLRLISVLVLGYGLSINLTEVMWKSILRLQYPDAVDYQRFMAAYSSIVGCVTFAVIFAGSNIIKHLGWGVGALATPMMMAVMALPVFMTAITGDFSNVNEGGSAAKAALKFAVLIGAAQSILSKATKYALFDPTTQMAYIPLDEECKVKGKAAIDGLGSRMGKSGGSLLQQGLVLIFGNVLKAAPAVAVVFYSVLAAWMVSAQRLAVLFKQATAPGGSTARAVVGAESISKSAAASGSAAAERATASVADEEILTDVS